jgi:hypothetical protein
MSSKEIEKSIKNLEDNIVSVQGDVCEGLYSNIIEVSNNLQSNLDEVNIRTNDRISNLPGVKSEDIPDFINNYKNRLKISVDEFVTFVRYFNLINSKLNRSMSEVYQLVFFGEKESVIKDIESTENETGLLDKNKFISKLKEDDLVLENVNDYIVDCKNYDEEIEYLNRIIGNPDNFYNQKDNGINYSLGIHRLVLLKKEVIFPLIESGYGNIIFERMMIYSMYTSFSSAQQGCKKTISKAKLSIKDINDINAEIKTQRENMQNIKENVIESGGLPNFMDLFNYHFYWCTYQNLSYILNQAERSTTPPPNSSGTVISVAQDAMKLIQTSL